MSKSKLKEIKENKTDIAKNKKVFVILALVLALLFIGLIFVSLSTDRGKAEANGIKANYKVFGDTITIKSNGAFSEGYNWNFAATDNMNKDDIILRPSENGNLIAEINAAQEGNFGLDFYYRSDSDSNSVLADVKIYFLKNGSNKISVQSFELIIPEEDSDIIDNSKQEGFLSEINTVVPSFKLPDGIEIKTLQNLKKLEDGTYVGGNDLSQFAFTVNNKDYDCILSQKIKFGTMLSKLTKRMKSVGAEKLTFDLDGIEVKGYDYQSDDENLSVCYFIIGKTRCFISSNEASFDETKNIAQEIINCQTF